MRNYTIRSVRGLVNFVSQNSSWSCRTAKAVVNALGFDFTSSRQGFAELSGRLSDIARYGASGGFSGFIYYRDTIAFYKKHRRDITANLESLASDLGEDIISLVQGFGVFRNDSEKPGATEIGRAIWGRYNEELTQLYNVFSWFTLDDAAPLNSGA